MSTTLVIPLEGLHADEMRAVRRAVSRALRNREIRQRFAELKDEIGQAQALLELHERYGPSVRQIERIVYGRLA